MTTTKTPTPRQQEIKDLMDAPHGLTVPQVADRLGISDNAVYQQLRRMKAKGGKKAAKRPSRIQSSEVAGTTAKPVVRDLSIEAHMESELADINTKLSEVALTLATASSEQVSLKVRKELLETAQKALTGKLRVAKRARAPRKPKGSATPQQ